MSQRSRAGIRVGRRPSHHVPTGHAVGASQHPAQAWRRGWLYSNTVKSVFGATSTMSSFPVVGDKLAEMNVSHRATNLRQRRSPTTFNDSAGRDGFGKTPFFSRAYLARFANGIQIRTTAVSKAIVNQASLIASVSAAFSTRGLSIDMPVASSGCAFCMANRSNGILIMPVQHQGCTGIIFSQINLRSLEAMSASRH